MREARPARKGSVANIASVAALLWLALPAPALGDEAGPDAYATGLVGGSWATLDTNGVELSTPAPIGGQGTDRSAFGGVAMGVIIHLSALDLRLEVEGTGGRSFDFITPGVGGPYFTSAKLWTVQGNFWLELPLRKLWPDAPIVRNIAPFGGGGLGVRQTSVETTTGGIAGRSKDTGLVWQGGGGLSYRLGDTLSVETRYQYADLGGTEILLVSSAGPQGTMEVDLGSHEVVGGVRITFR